MYIYAQSIGTVCTLFIRCVVFVLWQILPSSSCSSDEVSQQLNGWRRSDQWWIARRLSGRWQSVPTTKQQWRNGGNETATTKLPALVCPSRSELPWPRCIGAGSEHWPQEDQDNQGVSSSNRCEAVVVISGTDKLLQKVCTRLRYYSRPLTWAQQENIQRVPVE